jgi:hypothetical protein
MNKSCEKKPTVHSQNIDDERNKNKSKTIRVTWYLYKQWGPTYDQTLFEYCNNPTA